MIPIAQMRKARLGTGYRAQTVSIKKFQSIASNLSLTLLRALHMLHKSTSSLKRPDYSLARAGHETYELSTRAEEAVMSRTNLTLAS